MIRPSALAELRSAKFIHLTSTGRKTGKLHMVKLWFAIDDNKVYLSHEGEETDWMKNIKKNARIVFTIGGERFTGKVRYLEKVEDEAWTAKLALYEKYYGKSSKAVVEDWFSLSRLLLIDAVRPIKNGI
jgi:deazaflavin-dependent oxidoreductase (nitroreductase family)